MNVGQARHTLPCQNTATLTPTHLFFFTVHILYALLRCLYRNHLSLYRRSPARLSGEVSSQSGEERVRPGQSEGGEMLGQGGHAALVIALLLLLLWRQAAAIEVPNDRKSLSTRTQYVTKSHDIIVAKNLTG